MIALRAATPEDADVLAAMYARDREELVALERRPPAFFTGDGQRKRITQLWPDAGTRGWVVLRDDAIVGLFVLEDIRADSALVGYFVASAERGHGVATSALGLMIDVAFDELGIGTLIADILPDNAASLTVVARNRFQDTGMVAIEGETMRRFTRTR